MSGVKPILDIFGTDWDTPDGTAVRDFIHVVDLARGHIAALAAAAEGRTRAPFRTYNLGKCQNNEASRVTTGSKGLTLIGTGRGHTVREVLQSLEQVSQRSIPAREVGRRQGDVGFCVAEVYRAESELGWRAERTLDDCCGDVWNFTKARCPEPQQTQVVR